MNETDNKPKFIKFSDGRHGQELEVLADELASQMPKDVRGKLAPSVLWIARHFKTQNDDLRVNLEKVNGLESQIAQLTQERDQQKVDLDNLKKENVRLLEKSQEPQLTTAPKRTIEQTRELFAANKCPFCDGKLTERNGQYGTYVECEHCGARFAGSILNLLRKKG